MIANVKRFIRQESEVHNPIKGVKKVYEHVATGSVKRVVKRDTFDTRLEFWTCLFCAERFRCLLQPSQAFSLIKNVKCTICYTFSDLNFIIVT